MMDAIPDGAVFVKHQTGSTWNDGGRWHNVYFKKPDGTGGVIRMQTDYRHLDLEVEDWQPPEPTYTRAEVEAAVKRALDHYASAVRTLWAKCEQVEDACDEHLNNGKGLSEHEQGFWRGQKMLAKSIRRSTEMPASDPEALRRIVEGGE
jgi:hypothetical protein